MKRVLFIVLFVASSVVRVFSIVKGIFYAHKVSAFSKPGPSQDRKDISGISLLRSTANGSLYTSMSFLQSPVQLTKAIYHITLPPTISQASMIIITMSMLIQLLENCP